MILYKYYFYQTFTYHHRLHNYKLTFCANHRVSFSVWQAHTSASPLQSGMALLFIHAEYFSKARGGILNSEHSNKTIQELQGLVHT